MDIIRTISVFLCRFLGSTDRVTDFYRRFSKVYYVESKFGFLLSSPPPSVLYIFETGQKTELCSLVSRTMRKEPEIVRLI